MGCLKMANEKRLIDANAEIRKMRDALAKNKRNMRHLVYWVFDAVISVLEKAPTVDAVEVVHGRWEQVQRWATKAKYRCSVCGREIMSATKVNIEKYPYCHCGAKMDGDGNG